MKHKHALYLLILGAGIWGRQAMAAEIVNPKLTTDRSVDTSSAEAMARSLVREGMTDQEKALAVYNYVRRTMFHYRYLPDLAGGGTMDLINGVGYCLCTPTAGTQARLATLAGLNGHVLTTTGHGSVAVQYGGQWHWMDAFLGGCAWNKDRTAIATLDELVADPSLLRRDNPSPVPLFPCRAVLVEDALRWEPANQEYHKTCGPDDFDWTARSAPGKHEPMVWSDTSSLAITLRPGETYVRLWDHIPGMYFLFQTPEDMAPPHHFCGIEAEQRDTVNWPYWKPYVKEITSTDPTTRLPRTVKTGRYWANGRLTWRPDLSAADVLAPMANVRNLRVDGGRLVLVDPAQPGSFEWGVRTPYMLQGGNLFVRAGGKVEASVQLRPAGKRSKLTDFTAMPMRDMGSGACQGLLREQFQRDIGTRGYTLRVELSGGEKAVISELVLDTIFQLNMYALPQLMPGANEVTVSFENPDVLKGTRFRIEYAWDEGGTPRVESREVDRAPLQFRIDVAGSEIPRMRRLLFANLGPSR